MPCPLPPSQGGMGRGPQRPCRGRPSAPLPPLEAQTWTGPSGRGGGDTVLPPQLPSGLPACWRLQSQTTGAPGGERVRLPSLVTPRVTVWLFLGGARC